ncbi:probable carbohydrate esterase At4g34215 [Arachis stenosperma]|uniref:probable carbohydrate esterase At4g34215 n=1 Tax=Arachis stenosperma TaxID=217475 RepID=UPI0025AD05C1|nr:probable carbohydrate esterase At4g34215 [Arachis stenosperma]
MKSQRGVGRAVSVSTIFKFNPIMASLLPLLFVFAIQPWRVTSEQYKNIFILAGQSNMAGRGGVSETTATWDGVVPPESQPKPSILRLNAKLELVEAQEPLHADIDVTKTNGVGPGMAFANTILEKRPGFGVVGLVPCAIGGTNISEWERGKVHYTRMMKRVKASLQGGGALQALLWYQGESDTLLLSDAQSYRTRLAKFFLDLRADLNSPLLPIIQVALASGEGPYIDTVREAQLDMDLLNLRTVDAKGLPLGPDGLHLTTQAQVHLGQVMADAFLQFVPTSLPKNNVLPIHNGAPPTRPHNGASQIYMIPISITFLTIVSLTLL